MNSRFTKIVFVLVCAGCALAVGLLWLGLTREQDLNRRQQLEWQRQLSAQQQVACDAANQVAHNQVTAWDFLEQTVEAGWKKKPPTREQRRAAKKFFAGVKARLKPVEC